LSVKDQSVKTRAQPPHSSAVAVERAVQVLNALGERGEATLTEITRELGHGKTAVLRILNALVRQGLVQQDRATGSYSLSWRVLVLARSLANKAEVRTLALPYMLELRDLTSETVTLTGRVGFQRVCIEQVESPHELRWHTEIGSVAPLYAGSSGKMFLATFDPPDLDEYFAEVEFQPLTADTITDPAALRAQLEEIRANGYCYDHDTRVSGVAGLSAPVVDGSGAAVAVLTIGGPTERFESADMDRWRERLVAATTELTLLTARARADGG
jgi:IclR family transcriptional regulator, KDG regulon repressor